LDRSAVDYSVRHMGDAALMRQTLFDMWLGFLMLGIVTLLLICFAAGTAVLVNWTLIELGVR
jgi:hypothetical protein